MNIKDRLQKKNRLNYLINDLEEIMQIPDIHNRPNI